MAIEHVVVLMLENRSFDHMFALSHDPPPPGRFRNPFDFADPDRFAAPYESPELGLALDPPHSHAGVMDQLHLQGGTARMDGFAAAYFDKALGREPGRLRWVRIGMLASVLAAGLASVAGHVRSQPLWGPVWFALGFTLVALALAWIRPFMDPANLTRWHWRGYLGLVGIVALVAGTALLPWPAARFALCLAVAGAGVVFWRYRSTRPHTRDSTEAEGIARGALRCLPASRLPVLSALANEFALCTRWHSSVPGETWPNRNFLHAGNSAGATDIEPGFYDGTTVFDRLDEVRKSWRIYFDGVPQVWVFRRLWQGDRIANWRTFEPGFGNPGFEADARSGDLPAYTFIEPRHMGQRTNSQHPGNNRAPEDGIWDFERGEELIWRVYDALRISPAVDRTVLVITYDEHGGLWDRVPAPAGYPAPEPDRMTLTRWLLSLFLRTGSDFDFKRLGVRVPTVIVSSCVDPVPVDRLFDHTSVIATLRDLFGIGPLGARAAAANSFAPLLECSPPRAWPPIPEPVLGGASERTGEESGRAANHTDLEDQLMRLSRKVEQELRDRRVPGETLEAVGDTPKLDTDPARDVVSKFIALSVEERRGSSESRPAG